MRIIDLRIIILILILFLMGCDGSKSDIPHYKKEVILEETKIVDFMLVNWDYDNHFLIGADSFWIEREFLAKKSKEELLFSDRFYLSKSDLKEVLKFIVKHSSSKIDKKKLADNQKIVVLKLYGAESEVLFDLIIQHPYSEKYFYEFKKYLGNLDENRNLGLIIQNLNTYDSLLRGSVR